MVSNFSIRHAAHVVNQGGILAYPTDTIYGLGCDPCNQHAVERINTIKCRPPDKPFILLGADIEQFKSLIKINREQQLVIKNNTDTISWIVNASSKAPTWLVDAEHNITIRISRSPVVKSLCLQLGHAIISTSANPAGKIPAKNSLQIHQYFHAAVDKILATNKKLIARPSTIVRLDDSTIIRE